MSAAEKIDTIIEERKQAKTELWSRIQSEQPGLAELLKAVNRVFGRPEVEVKFNQEKICGR